MKDPNSAMDVLLLLFSALLVQGDSPSQACGATLDAYCGNEKNPELTMCYKTM
jgi:hypothetical protein